jgi:hypothetical protein
MCGSRLGQEFCRERAVGPFKGSLCGGSIKGPLISIPSISAQPIKGLFSWVLLRGWGEVLNNITINLYYTDDGGHNCGGQKSTPDLHLDKGLVRLPDRGMTTKVL